MGLVFGVFLWFSFFFGGFFCGFFLVFIIEYLVAKALLSHFTDISGSVYVLLVL